MTLKRSWPLSVQMAPKLFRLRGPSRSDVCMLPNFIRELLLKSISDCIIMIALKKNMADVAILLNSTSARKVRFLVMLVLHGGFARCVCRAKEQSITFGDDPDFDPGTVSGLQVSPFRIGQICMKPLPDMCLNDQSITFWWWSGFRILDYDN